MTVKLPLLILAFALVPAIGGGAAQARGLSASAEGPVDIAADEAEVQNKACVSIWRGNAEALQGDTRLRANVMKTYFETKAGERTRQTCRGFISGAAAAECYVPDVNQAI